MNLVCDLRKAELTENEFSQKRNSPNRSTGLLKEILKNWGKKRGAGEARGDTRIFLIRMSMCFFSTVYEANNYKETWSSYVNCIASHEKLSLIA